VFNRGIFQLGYVNQMLSDFHKRGKVRCPCVRNADNFLPVKQAEKRDFDFPCEYGGACSADFIGNVRD
jgi:hypothetical protein